MYTKQTWVNATTLITTDKLNNLETQYDDVVLELDTLVRTANTEILVEVVADYTAETATAGRIVFDSTLEKYYVGADGTNWISLSGGD